MRRARLNVVADPHLQTPSGKPRARSLGIAFDGEPGAWNAITDVPGLEVGYATLIEGSDVRTGVTAIHPRGPAAASDPCAAGFHSLNGNGEMTGVSWIRESGTQAGPIAITNTASVGTAHTGIVRWTTSRHPDMAEWWWWLLPVAAETWDGYLNDMNGGHVTEEVVVSALDGAAAGAVDEGSVGGGTGMNCYEFKGGTGTSSRLVEHAGTRYTVGVLLQTNFGARADLVVSGVPVGKALADDNPLADAYPAAGAGSVIAIVATDAPLMPHECEAMARRVTVGISRTGAPGSHFSGDLFLALSTGNPGAFTPSAMSSFGRGRDYDELRFMPWGEMDPFFEAVVRCTEEAVLNALVANGDMVGRMGHRSPALPRDRLVGLLRAAGRVA
jgi:D-aminopeptidase